MRSSRLKTLIFYSHNESLAKSSYNDDWLDTFCENRAFTVRAFNLGAEPLWRILPFIPFYELIVFLHSTNSNDSNIRPKLLSALKWRRGKVLFFVGNEYKLMQEKMAILREIEVDLIASQLPQDTAEWLYAECPKSKVISLPHALNPKVFKPEVAAASRKLDFGVRAGPYPFYLGDQDRVEIIDRFLASPRAKNFRGDIKTDFESRFTRPEWAAFLNQCRGTLSVEAGSSFLERDDRTRLAVNAYQETHPSAKFADYYEQFFWKYPDPVSGKCVSSRHFDAIGTKTCQIMFPGRFNDILVADEHYLALKRDFSNFDEVLDRFRDEGERARIVDRAYDFVLGAHTHPHRIESLLGSGGLG